MRIEYESTEISAFEWHLTHGVMLLQNFIKCLRIIGLTQEKLYN